MLGYTDAELCYRGSGYQFIHAADMLHCAENHIRSKSLGCCSIHSVMTECTFYDVNQGHEGHLSCAVLNCIT